jgi:hypothetical protein
MATENYTSPLPYSHVFANTGEPIEQEGLMEFRLLYEGELLPSGNKKTRPAEKHAIRRSLHPQLRRQWQLHSGLRQMAEQAGRPSEFPGISHFVKSEEERIQDGINVLGQQFAYFGYKFVPMVTDKHFVRCALDILLLRPEEEKFIFEQGDIDGQVKTIFDALQVPRSLEQVGGIGPGEDETPFFCLLQDDRLISEVRVNADQLLLLPHQREVKANDAFVVIHVRINARYPGAIGTS